MGEKVRQLRSIPVSGRAAFAGSAFNITADGCIRIADPGDGTSGRATE
jgi:hypothetical protein